jgi:phosphoglycerate kinase
MTDHEVAVFSERHVKPGDRWIYSADFNVKKVPHERVDCELDDLRKISDAQGITCILAHEGRNGDARHLDFVAQYLSEQLNRAVQYYPENATDAAQKFADTLKNGDIAVMGNTRMNHGEERNDLALAAEYAMLGDHVVIGGFGKAHRKNASNVGILECRRGYLSTSQENEMAKLSLWASAEPNKYSVAVLGGTKKEKIDGLFGLAAHYDAIIPGGIVLNTILKQKYPDQSIGASKIDDYGKTFEKEVARALDLYGDKIITPNEVIVAQKDGDRWDNFGRVNISQMESVHDQCAIVSYVMPFDGMCALARVAQYQGRLVVAGTPDISHLAESKASRELQYWLKEIGPNALILGGDSAHDLQASNAVVSTGGGSALAFLTTGTTAVYEALKEDAKIRGKP